MLRLECTAAELFEAVPGIDEISSGGKLQYAKRGGRTDVSLWPLTVTDLLPGETIRRPPAPAPFAPGWGAVWDDDKPSRWSDADIRFVTFRDNHERLKFQTRYAGHKHFARLPVPLPGPDDPVVEEE